MPNVPSPRTIVSPGGNFAEVYPSGALKVTGDVTISTPIVIGNITVSVDVTGDTTATQNAGDSYRVNQTGAWATAITGDVNLQQNSNRIIGRIEGPLGVQIVGSSGGGTVGVSGDVSLQQSSDRIIGRIAGPQGVYVVGSSGAGTSGISGDVSTTPKIGQIWPVSVQSGGGSGDIALVDGTTRSLKANVRDYVDANALAVAQTPSGDRTYWNEVIDLTVAGDNTVHTPATGKAFYIDNLFFSTGHSGEVLFKSGTTNITGPMNFSVNGRIAIDHSSFDERAKLKGRAINNTFVINLASVMDVGGYVTGYDQ
jgi:hypothetical protein